MNFPTYRRDAPRQRHGLHGHLARRPIRTPATSTAATQSGTVTYQNPQTFQIISSGVDGLYGVGGQYVASLPVGHVPPCRFDSVHTYNGSASTAETDDSVRQRESDNLTNFKSGTLQ